MSSSVSPINLAGAGAYLRSSVLLLWREGGKERSRESLKKREIVGKGEAMVSAGEVRAEHRRGLPVTQRAIV
jgi:hypothetical protein